MNTHKYTDGDRTSGGRVGKENLQQNQAGGLIV